MLFAVVRVAMIGGNRSPDVDVATPARAAVSSEPATDPLNTAFDRVEGPGDAPIPEVSDEASDERRRDVAESTRPTAAVSVDAGAVDDSALARGLTAPVVRDDASGWTVAEAKLCSQLDVRSADGSMRGEWRCAPIVDQTVPGPLFFYTRIRSRTDTVIEHRWLRNGLPVQQVNLEIKTNDGPGYRKYSLRTVSGDERGAWRVEVRSANGDLLVRRGVRGQLRELGVAALIARLGLRFDEVAVSEEANRDRRACDTGLYLVGDSVAAVEDDPVTLFGLLEMRSDCGGEVAEDIG